MYKILLCQRYLRSRYIALASVISVVVVSLAFTTSDDGVYIGHHYFSHLHFSSVTNEKVAQI